LRAHAQITEQSMHSIALQFAERLLTPRFAAYHFDAATLPPQMLLTPLQIVA
jgi:hypothetical protein